MKKIAGLLCAFLIAVHSFAQVESTIAVPTTASGSPTFQALLYLPSDYATSNAKYCLLVFMHGAGESCPPLSNIYNSTSAGGPSYFIEHGQWPSDGGFVNPRDGQTYKFIVLSPQSNCNGWSTAGDQADYIVQYMVSHYRIDTNRIYLTGLSAGGAGCIEYAAHIVNNGNENLTTATRRWKIAAMAPMSEATNASQQAWANVIVADSTRCWGFGDQNNDVYGEKTQTMMAMINIAKSGFARFTGNPPFTYGHGGWNNFYNPTYRETFTWQGVTSNMNIEEWFLTNSLSNTPITSPTANAGVPQNITLPTNSVTLTGTGTPGAGKSITNYAWIKVSGPSCTISPTNSPTTGTTSVTNMNTAGTYTFSLTVTQNDGQTASSSTTVTVNPPTPVIANAGPDQNVSLPTNSVKLDGSASTGATSYSWAQVSGPNTVTIQTPSAVSTIISGMIAGIYSFQLAINGGISTDNVNVTVSNAPTYPACGQRTKYVVVPDPSDSGVYINPGAAATYKPGDTIVLSNAYAWNYFEFDGFQGNPSCPLIVINAPTGQTKLKRQIKFDGSTYIKLTGTGKQSIDSFGIKIEYDPQLRYQGYHAVQISGKSKNIEVEYLTMHNVDMGIVAEGVESCDNSLNYPNWVMDTIVIHNNRIVGCWNEGMYIGNTSPDNASFDLRPVFCNNGVACIPPGAGCDTLYPAPPKNGYTHIYNNFVDSTGRGGIQLSNAAFGVSEINNNIVKHAGMNGDDAQGAAIDPGLYTRVYIHDNFISCTYTWGIASLGACATGIPLRIENNRIDSSGYLLAYDLATTSRDHIDPRTEPTSAPQLQWPYPIFVDTKTRLYTDQTPHAGTAVRGQDSTMFWIRNNVVGLFKAATRTDGGSKAAVQIQNDVPGIQANGNIICANLNFDGSPATIFTDNTNGVINYSTNCAATGNCNCLLFTKQVYIR